VATGQRQETARRVGIADGLVDGLGHQMSFGLIGKATAEMLADLFGTPATIQQLLDHCAQFDINDAVRW